MKIKQLATVLMAVLGTTATGLDAQQPDSAQLLAIHARILDAHRTHDLGSWMGLESGNLVSINAGRVSFPTVEQRVTHRSAYLASSKFEIYRDLRPPVVQVSGDGTMGWVIAEVEVKGTGTENGKPTTFHDIWAWVELYQKINGQWKLVGNASNRRPGS